MCLKIEFILEKNLTKEFNIILDRETRLRTFFNYFEKFTRANEEIFMDCEPTLMYIDHEDSLSSSQIEYSINSQLVQDEPSPNTIKIKNLSLFSLDKKKERRGKKKLILSQKDKPIRIFQLKLSLKEINPPIWRRILISNHANFYELHLAIQESFNWKDYHVHEFILKQKKEPRDKFKLMGLNPGGKFPDDVDIDFLSLYDAKEDSVKLCDAFFKNRFSVEYLYDFGDNWEVTIQLEKIYPLKKGFKGPICVNGKRAAPPEDSGGAWGYQELLDVIKDKSSPNYEVMKEWYPSFDPDKMNNAMKKMTLKQIERTYGPSIPMR